MKNTENYISIGEYKVRRIGLGTNRITDTAQARELLKHAVEAGVIFIDTADIYQKGASEETIGNTLSPYVNGLLIATKGGMVPGAPANNSVEHLERVLSESLKQLKLDCITLYQLHRVSPETPIKDTMNFFKQKQAEGKIKYIGLSEVTVEQIEEARKWIDVTSVQNHYNLGERKHDEVIDYCEKNGIVFIPFFPLSKGNNSSIVVNEIAKKYKASVNQIAISWLLKRSACMLPIPGTLSVVHLEENLAAEKIQLHDEDFMKLTNMNN